MSMFNQVFDNVNVQDRVLNVEAMHQLILALGDEDIYEQWINVVPDEPDASDFEFIAEDAELYNDCVKIFLHAMKAVARNY